MAGDKVEKNILFTVALSMLRGLEVLVETAGSNSFFGIV
jgi:hypothetical protein